MAYESLFEAELMMIEAKSDVEALIERNHSVKHMLEERRREVATLVRESEEAAKVGRHLLQQCQKILSDGESGEEQRQFLETLSETQTPEELEGEIESERTRLELVHEGNPNAIAEYEKRQKAIDETRERIDRVEQELQELEAAVREVRGKWEPELDELVGKISAAFAQSFERIGCAGQVEVYKDNDDFGQWAIQIQVKFRCVYFQLRLCTFYPINASSHEPSLANRGVEKPSHSRSSILTGNLVENEPSRLSSTSWPCNL